MNANMSLSNFDPIPNLECTGDLTWLDCVPGSSITGVFYVENVGAPNSLLNWEIESYPEWGSWSFDPENGFGLKPEDGVMTVCVEIVLPEEPYNPELTGEVVVVNIDDPEDFCCIDVYALINPPAKNWYRYFGFIDNLEICNETVMFHAVVVFALFPYFNPNLFIDKDVSLPNHYIGFVGKKFVFASFYY